MGKERGMGDKYTPISSGKLFNQEKVLTKEQEIALGKAGFKEASKETLLKPMANAVYSVLSKSNPLYLMEVIKRV